MDKPILYFDMDNVLVDFQSGLDKISDEIKEDYADDGTGKAHLDDIPGLFSLMDPMPGAIEAVNTLKEMFDVYILSTAPWKNPSAWSDKVLWVQKYFGEIFHKRLILTHNKHLCIQPGAYLIDDRPRHGASKFGEIGFSWEATVSRTGKPLLNILYQLKDRTMTKEHRGDL